MISASSAIWTKCSTIKVKKPEMQKKNALANLPYLEMDDLDLARLSKKLKK